MKITIVIPAYNEEKTIGGIVKKAKKYGKVIVVDDASKDNTSKAARKVGAKVVTHKKNVGLGGALRTGFNAALKTNADVIFSLDADGQHDPRDIPKFVDKINEGYDFVLGERDLSFYPSRKKIGNFGLKVLTNLISGTNLKDTEGGFRAFKADALKKLNLTAKRYAIAAEIVYEIGKNKLKATNVKVSSTRYIRGKGVGIIDGFENFLFIFRKKLSGKRYD